MMEEEDRGRGGAKKGRKSWLSQNTNMTMDNSCYLALFKCP